MHDASTAPAPLNASFPGPATSTESWAQRTGSNRTPSSNGDPLTRLIAAVIGLGTAWSLYPRGGVTFGNGVVLVLAPVVLSAAWRWKRSRIWLCLLAVWFMAAVFTEVFTHDSARHAVFALSRPSTVALNFCAALWALQQGATVARTYIVTLMIGLTAAIALYPSTNITLDVWKYGYGPVVSLAAVLVAAVVLNRGRRLMATVIVLVVALISLAGGFRSEFLVTSIAAAVCLLAGGRGSDMTWGRYLLIGGALAATTAAVYAGYGHFAADGQLGRGQQTRWVKQNQAEGGLLFGARPEIIASAMVIADPSVVGRGVSPQVSQQTRSEFLGKLQSLHIEVRENFEHYYFSRGLYLHSILFQQWAETGILALPGLLFPVLVLLVALMAAVRAGSGPATMVFCFLLCQLLWDTLFSPWPRLQSVYLGTVTAAAIVYLTHNARSGRRATVLGGGSSGKAGLT